MRRSVIVVFILSILWMPQPSSYPQDQSPSKKDNKNNKKALKKAVNLLKKYKGEPTIGLMQPYLNSILKTILKVADKKNKKGVSSALMGLIKRMKEKFWYETASRIGRIFVKIENKTAIARLLKIAKDRSEKLTVRWNSLEIIVRIFYVQENYNYFWKPSKNLDLFDELLALLNDKETVIRGRILVALSYWSSCLVIQAQSPKFIWPEVTVTKAEMTLAQVIQEDKDEDNQIFARQVLYELWDAEEEIDYQKEKP